MISKNDYRQILIYLEKKYPKAQTELRYRNSFELLIAVILSAQTTDKRVNKVTPDLFRLYPTAKKLGHANVLDVEKLISSVGLYHNKSKNIISASLLLHEKFHDQLPRKKSDLLELPGVGEKTANVVLGDFYKIPSFAVDTHVQRLAKRWDIVSNDADVKIVQKKLMALTPKKDWIDTHHRLVLFGRYICTARSPKCSNCEIINYCKYGQKRLGIFNV